ncbi:hypothetical protein HZB00_03765 [Candidatus Woesearchaeota archaeon]|nr:hypothetical protein [Candidatus Woesearchaeota archaeon]
MKKIIAALTSLSAIPLVSAQMMGYGMDGGWMLSFGLIYLAIFAFVFSVIFWLTYNWLAKKK